jgi:hypothetical protein
MSENGGNIVPTNRISMLGGTGETNVYGHCLYIKTKQRVLDLQGIQGGR